MFPHNPQHVPLLVFNVELIINSLNGGDRLEEYTDGLSQCKRARGGLEINDI